MKSHIEALLVEDNRSDAQIVEAIVSSSNISQPKLHHVERFDEALSMIEANTYDVILLDLHLPDGQGLPLIRQLKKIAPKMPVVVLTGLQDKSVEAAAFSEGIDDYVVKSDTFSAARLAQIGYVDIGNLLVQRLQQAINRAKLADRLVEDCPDYSGADYIKLDNLPVQAARLERQLYNENANEQADDESYYVHQWADAQDDDLSDHLLADRFCQTEQIAQAALYTVGITLMATLGSLHMQAGRYHEAEPLLEGALAIRKRLLGLNHPDVIVSLHALATLYDNQGKYKEAECLFYESLALCEQIFGVSHPVTQRLRGRILMIAQMNQSLPSLD